MVTEYSQNLSLTDIFNNKELENILPLVNYKEKTKENGKISKTTKMNTVNSLVFNTSKNAAKPFYKHLVATKSGNLIVLDGSSAFDNADATDAVYNALLGIKSMISFTANNADMIRSALKEDEKNKKRWGINTKLYLKVQSIQQIKGMNKQQLNGFMNDVMGNIIYGDNFPQTQEKYKVIEANVNSNYNYFVRAYRWKQKVGADI